jgi:hypothetical protein
MEEHFFAFPRSVWRSQVSEQRLTLNEEAVVLSQHYFVNPPFGESALRHDRFQFLLRHVFPHSKASLISFALPPIFSCVLLHAYFPGAESYSPTLDSGGPFAQKSFV